MYSERYDRQIKLAGFGLRAQEKLSEASVLVIGAGGLGCPALQYLAAAGIGNIGIADDDTVSLSNLHRQILYLTEDVGRSKVRVAAARLGKMNPEVRITPHELRIGKQNLTSLLKDYDYVIDGTDNFQTRYLINDTCALLAKPLVFAAITGFTGQLAIFNIDRGDGAANYRDIFPLPPAANEVPNCTENGVIGVLPGIIGTMAAAEVIKLITGTGEALINKLLQLDVLTWTQHIINIRPGSLSSSSSPEIASPAATGEYTDIDAAQMELLRQQPDTLIIDVREWHEQPELKEENIRQVPMSDFENLLSEEIPATHIIVLCQHGLRSRNAAEALQEKYGEKKQIYNLRGGIVRWMKNNL